MRMRMIEAHDGQTAIARMAARVDVRGGLDHETIRIVRRVRCAHRFDDRCADAEQQAAALGRQRVAGVVDDGLERRSGDANGYNASTTIAMPIPPPMHSDATP